MSPPKGSAMSRKKKELKLPKPSVFAHGAVRPVRFEVTEAGHPFCMELAFGSTSALPTKNEYPVVFYKLSDIEALHEFIGKCIEYAKSEGLQ